MHELDVEGCWKVFEFYSNVWKLLEGSGLNRKKMSCTGSGLVPSQ